MLGAAQFGYEFATRTPAFVRVRVRGGAEREYQVLHVIDFTSTRKRMSVLVRTPEGGVRLLCKGADSVLWPRLAGGDAAPHADATLAHLEMFATEGLRTLVFAVADIAEPAYQVRPRPRPAPAPRAASTASPLDLPRQEWADKFNRATMAIQDREQRVDEAAMLIEDNLRLLGATAIEDRLQVCARFVLPTSVESTAPNLSFRTLISFLNLYNDIK